MAQYQLVTERWNTHANIRSAVPGHKTNSQPVPILFHNSQAVRCSFG